MAPGFSGMRPWASLQQVAGPACGLPTAGALDEGDALTQGATVIPEVNFLYEIQPWL